MTDNSLLTAELRQMMNEELNIMRGEFNAKFTQQAAQHASREAELQGVVDSLGQQLR
jgi:hypothetical protein